MTKKEQVRNYVNNKIQRISQASDSTAAAQLARMRHSLGKKPGQMPETWSMFLQEFPENLMGKGSKPSEAENAVYNTLTLYGYHQQGKDVKKESMHMEKYPLGKSIRALVPAGDMDAEDRILRKFQSLASVSTIDELVYHLKSMIGLMRREGIPTDYAQLAQDLYTAQFPGGMDQLRLRWGREFYSTEPKEENEKKEG